MKKHIFSLFVITSLLLLTGCVSTKARPLSKSRAGLPSGATIAETSRPIPAFADFKPSNAMFGAIGGLASVSSGNDIIRNNGVTDPAVAISEALADHLQSEFKVVRAKSTVDIDTTRVQDISKRLKGTSDYVLDVQTVNWSCVYMPLNWTRYRVIYSVKLRLIDVNKSEPIAEGFFAWQTPDTFTKPTYEELFANNASVLVDQLGRAKEAAIVYFKSEILK